MAPKIGVFPASGSLATSIINHLLRLVPASELLLIARYPDKFAHLSRDGATIRYADYDEPESLKKVFDGVGVLMLVSYASFEIEHRVEVPFPSIKDMSWMVGANAGNRRIKERLIVQSGATSNKSSTPRSPSAATYPQPPSRT